MCRRPLLSQGFTLIEVLVVLVIIGIAIGGASAGLDVLHRRDADLAVGRLRHVLEAAARQAQVRGHPVAFDLVADGYRFSTPDAGGIWNPWELPPRFVARILPDTLRWGGLRIGGRMADRIVFGNRSPEFELILQTPSGNIVLSGRATGQVVETRNAGAS